MLPSPLPAPLAYAASRYSAEADGKTLLVGFAAQAPLFAVAVGLAGEQDRQRFAVLARYLLRRDAADGYWLVLPANLGEREHLVAEVASVAGRECMAAPAVRDEAGRFRDLDGPRPLAITSPLGDLLDGGEGLAGLMRRELDRLAEAVAQPLP